MLAKYLHDAASPKHTHTYLEKLTAAAARVGGCATSLPLSQPLSTSLPPSTSLALNSEVDAIEIENKNKSKTSWRRGPTCNINIITYSNRQQRCQRHCNSSVDVDCAAFEAFTLTWKAIFYHRRAVVLIYFAALHRVTN